MFNDKPYEISLKDEKSLRINESEYEVGARFKLDGVDVVVENISENTTTLSIKIFNDKDLTLIQSSRLGYSRIVKQDIGYVFTVPVEISDEASEAYEKTTKNIEVVVNPTTGESYSKYPISIFIDDEQFISVPILNEGMGEKITNLVLWSYSPDIEESTENMVRLKTVIEMKSLPQELTFVKREFFKSTYGEFLTTSLLFVILIASVITTVLFFVKFRKSGVASLPLNSNGFKRACDNFRYTFNELVCIDNFLRWDRSSFLEGGDLQLEGLGWGFLIFCSDNRNGHK